jgi:hypothetical protein
MEAIQPFNKPVPVELEEYDSAIRSYLAKVTSIPGVRSAFTMGSVKAPGLSDIDMIVIVDDDFNSSGSHRLSTSGIDDRLFLHGPVVLPASMTSALQYVIYATGLNRLHGEDDLPAFEQLHPEVANTLRIAYAVDFLQSRQVQYERVLRSRRIDQRVWMTRLWSLTHSEALFDDAGVEISDSDRRVLDRVKDLREQWIESRCIDDREFLEVFLLSLQTSRSLWMAALNYGYERTAKRSDCLKLRAGNILFEFREEFESCEASFCTIPIPRYPVTILHVKANPVYMAHLAMYRYVDANLVPATSELDGDCLAARARHVRRHHDWIAGHCARAGSMSGYTGVSIGANGLILRSASHLVGLIRGYDAIRT